MQMNINSPQKRMNPSKVSETFALDYKEKCTRETDGWYLYNVPFSFLRSLSLFRSLSPNTPPILLFPHIYCSLLSPLSLSLSPVLPHSPHVRLFTLPQNRQEYQRLGFESAKWRWSSANEKYGLTDTFPASILAPAHLDDENLQSIADFRSRGRMQLPCWRNKASDSYLSVKYEAIRTVYGRVMCDA
jgi:hypothetical protein